MSPSEYQQLEEFIAKQFEKRDVRFDGMDARFNAMDARFDRLEERVGRVQVTGEQTQHDLRLLIERVDVLDAKVERYRAETKDEFASVRRELRDTARSWGSRIEALERRAGGRES